MNISESATRIFGLILFLFFANSVYSQSIYTLPVGTQIDARMDGEINSKVFSAGDTFTATISKPLIAQTTEMLPIGTIIEGRIIKIQNARIGKKPGSFEVRFETLKLPNGAQRRIEGELIRVSEPHSAHNPPNAVFIGGGTAIGTVLGALAGKSKGALIGAAAGFGIGTAIIFLQKGEEARLKSNEEIKIRLTKEVTLPVEDF